jgi:hypothetical protein
MLVVTPTLKAAQVAAREVGTAGSVAWLVHQHGFRWDQNGQWSREVADRAPGAVLGRGDLLLVDLCRSRDYADYSAGVLESVASGLGCRRRRRWTDRHSPVGGMTLLVEQGAPDRRPCHDEFEKEARGAGSAR